MTNERLTNARITVETMLNIVHADRRTDGGWVLWHDPEEMSGIPADADDAKAIWLEIDAAISALDEAGWLSYRGRFITVTPTQADRDLLMANA